MNNNYPIAGAQDWYSPAPTQSPYGGYGNTNVRNNLFGKLS